MYKLLTVKRLIAAVSLVLIEALPFVESRSFNVCVAYPPLNPIIMAPRQAMKDEAATRVKLGRSSVAVHSLDLLSHFILSAVVLF